MPTLATGYKYRKPGQPREVEPFTDLKAMTSMGNIATTVEDLAKFLSLQFRDGPAGGDQILKGSTLREMHRVQWLDDDWETGHALGWHLAHSDDRTLIRHGGYVPGHTTSISAAPAEKFGVIVLTNAGDGMPGSYASKAWSIVAPAVEKAMEVEEEPAVADASWSKYVGEYEWFDAAMMRVMLLNGVLCLVDPHSNDPWEDRIQLELVSDGVFRMKDQWQKGELVRFEVDDTGSVTRLIMPGYALVRR
jgi:CubicO group peptidase (beta-lactamase class C family)